MLHLLGGMTFADAYAIDVEDQGLPAESAAQRVFLQPPRWITLLMRWRDRIVTLIGLKGVKDNDRPEIDAIGGFPVVLRTPERLILGFDDWHLDFRIVIDALHSPSGGTRIRTTTLVAPHNLLGRLYLAIVLPFHRRIVPAMLNTVRLS
ncbi:MAG: hypothetical protein CFE31_00295 [Rhizobiales bacterium PAR1]|nr:MAG: hypothetical protein CFE31_00295 [Rhizobiales bacterium PAR1]